MFGLNEITWSEFLSFILFCMLAWYTIVIVWAWFKSSGKNKQGNFEDYHSEIDHEETLQPITVSSKSFPSEILPVNPVENVRLEATLYEEAGYADGLGIEHFMENGTPRLAKMLPDIQYQQ